MDLLLHNLRTGGIRHDDWSVAREAADEIERLREALKIAKIATAGIEFEAKRLRRVAMLMGISVPESDEALMVAAGGVLGEIERAIERALQAPNREGERLPTPRNEQGVKDMENAQTENSAACGQSRSTVGLGGWIPCSERMPDDGQTVAFVVRASNRLEYMNGRVLGGKYSVQKYSGGFSVPGLVVDAWYWLPLPDAPALPPNA